MCSVGNPQRPVTKDFISLDELEKENHMFSYFKYFASAQAIHDMDTGVNDTLGPFVASVSEWAPWCNISFSSI